MLKVEVSLPESLHAQARRLAERDGVTVAEWITRVAAERIVARLQPEYDERARRGSRETYLRVLRRVPSVDPEPYDRI